MITIQNSINSAKVFADSIDSGAEGLIRALCGSPISEGSSIRIMPDVHAGKGCAIGTTMTIHNCVAPGLVGVDIGCGMTVLKVTGKRLEMQKLDKLIHESIPAGRKIRDKIHRYSDRIDLTSLKSAHHVQIDKALHSIGTLGGGNHFIEVDRGDDGSHWLIIHSGSRRLGTDIANHYLKIAHTSCPNDVPYEFSYLTGDLMQDYLHDMSIAQEFAEINRQAIAADIIKGMKLDIVDSFSTVHNYIDTNRNILRKGAVSALTGERLIIPMNMRDGCLICVGKGNVDWNFSAPHGAGRLMSRSQSKQSFTLSLFKKEMNGIYTTSISHDTLDESPMAYKPIESILAQIGPTVDVIEQIRPIYNFKAGEE